MNYYNEFDPNAAAWLRGLIANKLIPAGEADERSINDVIPTDLSGYTQCHFFAGIGGWSLALRLAGWPDDRPVWTGSCPCQPFSAAGKQMGRKDPRHLWPALRRLINQCRPPIVFGEQVASADGRKWLAGVRSNLETMGYAVGTADLCAAGIHAPHIRQRLFWVADSDRLNCDRAGLGTVDDGGQQRGAGPIQGKRDLRRLADAASASRPQQLDEPREGSRWETGSHDSAECSRSCWMGNSHDSRSQRHDRDGHNRNQSGRIHAKSVGSVRETGGVGFRMGDADCRGCLSRGGTSAAARHGGSIESNDFWADSTAIRCADGKDRRIPIEPALFPLADGLPYKLARRGSIRPALLKGAGNAIVPQLAARFIRAFMEERGEA
jgi:DNA (cytosine-5)-methyltransferase 1